MEDLVRMQIINMAMRNESEVIAKEYIEFYNKTHNTEFEITRKKYFPRNTFAKDKEKVLRIECVEVCIHPDYPQGLVLTYEQCKDPFPQVFSGDLIDSVCEAYKYEREFPDVQEMILKDPQWFSHGILILSTNDLSFGGTTFRGIKKDTDSHPYFCNEIRERFKEVFVGYSFSPICFSNLDEEW